MARNPLSLATYATIARYLWDAGEDPGTMAEMRAALAEHAGFASPSDAVCMAVDDAMAVIACEHRGGAEHCALIMDRPDSKRWHTSAPAPAPVAPPAPVGLDRGTVAGVCRAILEKAGASIAEGAQVPTRRIREASDAVDRFAQGGADPVSTAEVLAYLEAGLVERSANGNESAAVALRALRACAHVVAVSR